MNSLKIVNTDVISYELIRSLYKGEVLAIRLRNYVNIELCQKASIAVNSIIDSSQYTLTKDLKSLGTSIGEAHESVQIEKKYFDNSVANIRIVRNAIFQDKLAPIDKLRLELDEIWPSGSVLGRYNSKPMLSNVIRVWSKGNFANPHIDHLEIKLLKDFELKMRIGANLYLQTPGQGGSLQFWDLKLNLEEYQKIKREDYGLNREEIGPPSLEIKPEQGDLILFDAGRVHAVEEVKQGKRITAACFIGINSAEKPIRVFA